MSHRRRHAAMNVLLAALAVACGEPHSVVSGTIELDFEMPMNGYSTLEIRAVEFREDEPDARVRPLEPAPFVESLELEGLLFPRTFEIVEDAFYDWADGWAVAWLSQRGAPEPDAWVLDDEPFGATRIVLVEPGTNLAPSAKGARIVVRMPE